MSLIRNDFQTCSESDYQRNTNSDSSKPGSTGTTIVNISKSVAAAGFFEISCLLVVINLIKSDCTMLKNRISSASLVDDEMESTYECTEKSHDDKFCVAWIPSWFHKRISRDFTNRLVPCRLRSLCPT